MATKRTINVEEVYDQHFEALYRFFYFKVLNRPLAEDLTSQTFTKFVEAIQKKREIRDPANFLYGIGRNVFNNYLRDKYKEKQVYVDDLDNIAAVTSETPRRGASLEERALPHIEQLPESQRRVAYMRLIEKQSNGEIANALNRSNSYVKTTLRRALRSLESSAGTFRSKVPLIFFFPVGEGRSFFRLLNDSAATPDPGFVAGLKATVAASAAAGGAVASEAAGLLAKVQTFFKNPTNAGATTAAAVAVAAAALALSGNPEPPASPPPPEPQPPAIVQETPPPEPEPEPPEPVVAAAEPNPPQVLAAVSPPPLPLPEPPAPPVKLPQADDTWLAEFWILERFNQSELPEIPDRAPDYTRFDTDINFDWGFRSPATEIDFPRNHFAVRWTKTEVFAEPGTYEFTTVSDDGVRAYVDNELIIDNWTNHRATADTTQIELDAGAHELTVEYFDNNVEAEISFDYEKVDEPEVTSSAPEPIPEKVAADAESDDHVAVHKPISPKKPLSART